MLKTKLLMYTALFGVILLVSNCKKDDPDPGDPTPAVSLITPGEGITGIKIGDPAQKAIDLYGTVAPSYGSIGSQYNHFLTYFSKGVIVYCEPTTEETFNAQMKIKSLDLSAPFDGKTEKGIGIGSTKTEVKAAYGEPASSSAFFGDEYAIGITFTYDDNGVLVESIEIE
ncbi:MAG: hypothetical protein IT261_09575 [Saprospiraceae bacterium]|nr:hypothetical protein [Saprospiraceae bacterium]